MAKKILRVFLMVAALLAVPLSPFGGTFAAQAKAPHLQVDTQRVRLPSGTETSSNWAGYAVTSKSNSSPYKTVSGTWTVPIAYGMSGSLGAQWVGLGGYDSSSLLQLGTIEEMSGGREVATLFWEKLPDAAQQVAAVPVGSKVTASISRKSGSTWVLKFHIVQPNKKVVDKTITTGVSTAYMKRMGTSAEWISEIVSDGDGKLYPLANTGVVKYSKVAANGTSVTASANRVHPLAASGSSRWLQLVPSNLQSGGTAFNTQNARGSSFKIHLSRHLVRSQAAYQH